MGVSAITYEKGRWCRCVCQNQLKSPLNYSKKPQSKSDWPATRHFYQWIGEAKVVFRKDHHIAMFYKHSVCINMAKTTSTGFSELGTPHYVTVGRPLKLEDTYYKTAASMDSWDGRHGAKRRPFRRSSMGPWRNCRGQQLTLPWLVFNCSSRTTTTTTTTHTHTHTHNENIAAFLFIKWLLQLLP